MAAHAEAVTKTALAKRDISIDSLRGIAILLMVAGHVIGSAPDRGMNVTDDSLWRYFYIGLEDIRMPLFAMLSGYVYAHRPVRGAWGIGSLGKGKARRLLVPLVTVGTIFFFTQLLVPGTNSKPEVGDLWKMYVYGGEHLWFVQAMFLIFVLVGVLDAFNVLRSLGRWLVAFGIAAVIFTFIAVPMPYAVFSVNGAIRLLPFFLLGYGLNKFSVRLENRKVLAYACGVFLVAYSLRFAAILGDDARPALMTRLIEFAVGVAAVIILMLLRSQIRSRALAWLGAYSYGIYLLHVFGSAGSRIVLGRAGIDADWAIFGMGMVFAVGLPIIFQQTFGRVRWISWAILGQRPTRVPAKLS